MKLYPVFVLLLSFGKKFTANFAKIFVVKEGRKTKTGYGSRCFVLIRVRTWVTIHKQLDMNL
jgi:hypothetical protein